MDMLRKLNINSVRQELVNQYNRATSTTADDVDLLAINLFASMVQQHEANIAYEATKIIAVKFKSANSDEVLLALNVLEECMSKCGSKFHSEIGKFRFLNELIRLVSPQYDGQKTPKKIKDKILDLLLIWKINFPNEPKIKEAYDMLLSKGVKHEHVKGDVVRNTTNGNSGRNDGRTGREQGEPVLAARLKGLLQSSRPTDIQAANLLIQNMVKENERRMEVQMRRKLELKEISNNATLLKEMLDASEQNGTNTAPTEDEITTMKSLHDACKQLQPTILIILGDAEESECLAEAVDTNEFMTEVFRKYQRLVANKTLSSDLITPIPTVATNNNNQSPISTMDELNAIFASDSNSQTSPANHIVHTPLTPLAPTPAPVIPQSESNGSSDKMWQTLLDVAEPSPTTSSSFESLSRTMNPVLEVASNAKAPMIPASAIVATSETKATAIKTKFENFDSQLHELITGLKSNLAKETESPTDDDKLILIDDAEAVDQAMPTAEQPSISLIEAKHDSEHAVGGGESASNNGAIASPACNNHTPNKRLTDIVIDLNTIEPHHTHLPRCILDDKSGLKIILNFAKDRPMDAVAVLVITTTNQSSLPITNFQFEASVSKPCKLHLQKPSGTQLAGIKPFRPATDDITQVLLISNAERKALKLVCIISYILGDDPDPVKEFLEVNDLPDLFS